MSKKQTGRLKLMKISAKHNMQDCLLKEKQASDKLKLAKKFFNQINQASDSDTMVDITNKYHSDVLKLEKSYSNDFLTIKKEQSSSLKNMSNSSDLMMPATSSKNMNNSEDFLEDMKNPGDSMMLMTTKKNIR